MTKDIESQLSRMESRLNGVEMSIAHLKERDTQTPAFTPSQLENVLARLTILENKVAIMDAQVMHRSKSMEVALLTM
jgi:hypothetical protein